MGEQAGQSKLYTVKETSITGKLSSTHGLARQTPSSILVTTTAVLFVKKMDHKCKMKNKCMSITPTHPTTHTPTLTPTHTHTCSLALLLDQRELVSVSVRALEEERRAAALELPVGDDGDAVTQEVRLVHVVRGQQDGSTWWPETHGDGQG